MTETALNTLYVHNLNDQIPVTKLRENLYVLFSTYGEILEVNMSPALRGQAFIVFTDATEAKKALRATQNQIIFGKELKVEYAKTESKKVAVS
ncbi:CYFA0S01e19592g1_1 [Cyberlindnera fabianii]|uniref:CYFA0S01e19592g1_1 n=1 Tax=Cyberlindnera fabianii TaxID=36022 RepID=A0A061AKB6_CYBFA|nr:CYFA0S01e19592g1_1 [Cyberlindnera fabianii]